MQRNLQYSTWVEIDLGAIQQNVQLAKQLTGVQVMAIVKANAYGHGAVMTAQAALRGGAAWCGVARIEEALDLRRAGLECSILVLGYTPQERLPEALINRISLAVWDENQLMEVAAAAIQTRKPAFLHLKVDTGMGRIGIQPKSAFQFAALLAATPGVVFEGLFTHFARADEADPTTTEQQESIFLDTLQRLESNGLRPSLVHASNSAAGLVHPTAHFDMIRLGIAMYGLHPSDECLLPSTFKPPLAWKAVLSHVKYLPAGHGISYGHEYTTHAKELIGTVPVGYADGFRRAKPNQALVAGRRVSVVGRVCMDQIMLRLDDIPDAHPGDEVVLIGAQGTEKITAEQVALRWDTNNYEVVCGISARVPRLYHGDPES